MGLINLIAFSDRFIFIWMIIDQMKDKKKRKKKKKRDNKKANVYAFGLVGFLIDYDNFLWCNAVCSCVPLGSTESRRD